MTLRRVLVVRNDKLGDLLVSFPAFALLRASLPEAELHALVAEGLADVAALCPAVDVVHGDPGPLEGRATVGALAAQLGEVRADALVALFSTLRTALAARRARIPYRLAPATKLAQLLYTDRLLQRRSRSAQPEWAYNQDLVRRLLCDHGVAPAPDPRPPFLRVDPARSARATAGLRAAHGLPPDAALVFIHPGSGGSAPNLAPEAYAALARGLRSARGHAVVVSAGPGERALAERVAAGLGDLPNAVYESTAGLARYAEHVAGADVFVSGSTGVLHVAGALDRPTAAFYTRRRSGNAVRWRTLNSESRRLAFSPAADRPESDLASIDLAEAAEQISRRFLLRDPAPAPAAGL